MHFLFLPLLFFFCAAINAEMTLYQDLEITPFINSKIIREENRSVFRYTLALAPYHKKRGRWEPERFIHLNGALDQVTYELPRDSDESIGFEYYHQQLPNTREVLFHCQGRDCGESNNWANDHFGVKQLYGLDQFQNYGVYRLKENTYVTLYSVRRGNQRAYVHLDILHTTKTP